MKYYDRLIVVSNTDTASGPMAAALLARKLMLEDILVVTRGLVVLFPEPVNAKAEAVLASHGLSVKDHYSEPLVKEDFDDRTLVLTVSNASLQKVQSSFEWEPDWHLASMEEYSVIGKEPSHPYGGSLADYGKCYEELDRLTDLVAEQIKKEDER